VKIPPGGVGIQRTEKREVGRIESGVTRASRRKIPAGSENLGEVEARETALMDVRRRLIAPALTSSLGPEWNECHEADSTISYRTTIYASLHQDEMKWRDLLHVPKNHRRTRSGAGSETDSLRDASGVDPVALRPTESTPDLRVGASTVPMLSPLTSRNQESNGTQIIISQMIHLTTLFSCDRLPFGFRSNPIRSWKRPKRWQLPKISGSYC